MASIDAAIAERAREQLGLITIRQLESAGCSRAHRRRLVRDGWLQPESRSVFRVGPGPLDWRTDVLAAIWSAGPGAAASHRTAARLWGFDGDYSRPVELVLPEHRRVRLRGATVRRSRDLDKRDFTRLGPIPITSRVRTLIDLAAVVDRATLEQAIDGALRDRTIRRAQLVQRALELRRPGRSGPGAILDVLGTDGSTRTESWLERQVLLLLRRAGLPAPKTQVLLAVGGAGARADFLYARQRLIIEVDGHRTHSTRRQRQRDAERTARLMARGWRVLRFTYEDVAERPAYVVATVATLLAAA